MNDSYRYNLSGYIFETNVFFPELQPTVEHPVASIYVRETLSDAIPKEARNADSYKDDTIQLRTIKLKHFGLVALWNNRDVEFTPAYTMGNDTLRMILLGSVSMMLSSMLGYVALHAGCVIINDKAVLFCARAGRGKSSLAAYFYKQGYSVLSDDVTNIKISDAGSLMAYISVPRFKLMENSLDFIGASSEGLMQMPTANKKYSLPFVPPLQTCYEVSTVIYPEFHKGDNELVPITGMRKLPEIKKHLYRKKNAALLGEEFTHNRNKVLYQLSVQTAMYFFKRPENSDRMQDSLAFIERELTQ